jgi:hypothetical protein
MTSEHCFAKIADSLDVQALVKAINSHAHLWDVITERQNYRGSAHHDTQAIIVRGPRPETRDAFNELWTVDYPYAKPLAAHVDLLTRRCCMHIGLTGELGRVMLVNLRADGHIDSHVDEGRYADTFERFHLAIIAAKGVRFNVAEHSFEALSGELWWFNHKLTHSVVNLSGADRWHLIIDVCAPRYRERIHAS